MVGKHLCWSLFLITLQAFRSQKQVFSCEYCEIFKNNFFYRTPLVTASGPVRRWWIMSDEEFDRTKSKYRRSRREVLLKKRLWHQVFSCEFCEICKNTFSYRIPLVASFEKRRILVSHWFKNRMNRIRMFYLECLTKAC